MNIASSFTFAEAARQGSAVLWQASWQSGVVALLLWCVCQIFPSLPASARCWLWRLALLKFLLAIVLPFATVRLPLLPAPPTASIIPETVSPVESLSVPLSQVPPTPRLVSAQEELPAKLVVSELAPSPSVIVAPEKRLAVPSLPLVPILLLALWLLGVAIGVIWLLQLAMRSRRWLREGCVPVTDAALLKAFAPLAKRLGVRTLPPLLTAPDISLPMLVGFRRPAVVLPVSERLADFTEGARHLMLAHELAHLRRHDLWWNWLSTVVQILFFFHPLVYLARREEELAREMACDLLALDAVGAPVAEYGTMLFQIASQGRSNTPVTVLAISGAAGALKQRLIALQNRSPLTPGQHHAVMGLILTVAVLGLIPWRVVAQQSSPKAAPAKTSQHSVQGRVVSPGGKPVAGASVTQYFWMTRQSTRLATVPTGADGSFQLPWKGELTGSEIIVTAPGMGIALVSPPDRWDKPVAILLRPATAIRATFLDPKGHPVPNLPIRIMWSPPKRRSSFWLDTIDPERLPTRTDSKGKVRVTGIPQSGDIWFDVADSRFAHTFPATRVHMTGGAPEPQTTVNLQLAASAEGRITFGSTGKPAAKYRVIAEYTPLLERIGTKDAPLFVAQVISDAQGHYRFDKMRPGNYQFHLVIGNQLWAAPIKQGISLLPNQTRSGIDFALIPTATVRGRVIDAITGRPVAGVKVSESSAGNSSLSPSVGLLTSSDGDYNIRVPQGKVIIQLSDSPYAKAQLIAPSGTSRYQQLVTTKGGQEYTADFRVRAQFAPTGIAPVTGRVLGPDRKPVAGAEVIILLGESGTFDEDIRTVRTNAQGQFRAESLPLKWLDYRAEVRVRSGGFVSQPTQVRVSRSTIPPLTLSLVRGLTASISGRVTDSAGHALSGVPVELIAWGNGKHFTEEIITDTLGRYQFSSLWPDMNYRVSVQPKGYVGRSLSVREGNAFKPGEQRTNRNLVLSTAGRTLSGQVVTPAGRPVSKVTLSLSAGDGDFHGAMVDASGHFAFKEVGDGPMTLTVQPRWGDTPTSAAACRQIVRASDSPLRVVVK